MTEIHSLPADQKSFRDVDSLVDNVFRSQNIDWAEILQQMATVTTGEGDATDTNYNGLTRMWRNWPPEHTPGAEVTLGQRLNNISDIVRKNLEGKGRRVESDLTFSSTFASSPIAGKKPELVIVSHFRGSDDSLSWQDIKVVVSLSDEYTLTTSEECAQLAEYATHCFQAQPDRRYVLGIGFRHTWLRLYCFDRSGGVSSNAVDVNEHPVDFLRIVIGVLFLGHEALGYDTTFESRANARYVKFKDKKLNITKYIYVDDRLRCRGTVCLKVQRSKGSSDVCVVKDTWNLRSSSLNEVEMLKLLKELKIKNVSRLVDHEFVKATNFETGEIVGDNTGIFRNPSMGVEIRDHLRIVMQPYGEPITKFSSLIEFLYAMLDILRTIKELDEKGIIHRDISPYNILLVTVDGSKYRKGFLIDFDGAIEKDKGDELMKGRRCVFGTLPFIAIDLLHSFADHSAEHDAESLLYVLIWIATSQAGPNGSVRKLTQEEISRSILRSWDSPGYPMNSAAAKSSCMMIDSKFIGYILYRIHPYFYPLRPFLLQLRRALFPPQPVLLPDNPTDEDYDKLFLLQPEDHAISREKLVVFRDMEEAFVLAIDQLLKEETEGVSTEPSNIKGPGVVNTPVTTTTATSDASKGTETAQCSGENKRVHHMNLRKRLVNKEGSSQGVMTEKKGKPVVQSQPSLKRSRLDGGNVASEDSEESTGEPTKRLRLSTGLNMTGRTTRAMSSEKKECD